jgi:hypothetical protein
MYYYADGDYALIRVHVNSDQPPDLHEFHAAHAQRYMGGAGWVDKPGESLTSKAIYSGDFYPVDEAEATRIMAVLDAQRE